MSILYRGSASNPADNGSLTGPSCSITPPAGMLVGDLVIVPVQVKFFGLGANEVTVSNTGGQTWVILAETDPSAGYSARVFACRFNGTWTADPVFDGLVANGITGKMTVFYTDIAGFQLDLDVMPTIDVQYAAPSTPFTVTISLGTTPQSGSLTYAVWFSNDVNTWDTLTAGWTVPASAQYRNSLASNLMSLTDAYRISATASVSKNQATNGGDLGSTFIVSFKEVLIPAFGQPPDLDMYIDFEGAADNTLVNAALMATVTKLKSAGGTWSNLGTQTPGTDDTTRVSTIGNRFEGRRVLIAGTIYDEMGGSVALKYDHSHGSNLYQTQYAFAASHDRVSTGFFFKTSLAYAAFNSWSGCTLYGTGQTDFVVFNIFNAYAGEHQIRLETFSGLPTCCRIFQNVWYYATMLYDRANLRAYLAVFEPENNWVQRGFTVYAPISNLACINANIVRTGGSVVNDTGITYFDDFIYDWTAGVFPLTPAPGGVKTSIRRGNKQFRRRFIAQMD